MTAAEKLIEVAKGEIGYLEKASNAYLDDKTKNAGKANYTKYGAWYGINPGAWCAMFVSWCADRSGTSDVIPSHASCTAGIAAFKNLGRWHERIGYSPKPGDIIYFGTSGSPQHVGIVTNATSTRVYTIEGNTSGGNTLVANGGGVAAKDYALNYSKILGYGNPAWPTDGGDSKMNIVKGSTESEKALIKAVQKAVGANADGEIGTQTMTDIACLLQADCFPLTVKLYSAPVIIARDIVPFSAGGATLGDYKNTINGSFYANKRPCSILVQDGITVQADACHASYDKPESVIYRLWSGETAITRIKHAKELPAGVMWAVGGVGLLNNYNPAMEGFCKCTKNGVTEDFSDVLRKTNHAMLGCKNNYMYLVYCANMTAAEVNAFAQKLGLKMALMLDGGHVAGINGTEDFAKINTGTAQYYGVQGVK